MKIFSGKKGNEQLIEEIILKNYNQYYRLAFSYVHNVPDAEDIVQNGAYKALRSSSTLIHREYAETWVYRIMLNEVFRVLKEVKPVSYEAVLEEKGNEPESAEDTYTNVDLQKALDALPARDKAIVDDLIAEFEKSIEDKVDYQDIQVTSEVLTATDKYFTLKLLCYRGAGSGYAWNLL